MAMHNNKILVFALVCVLLITPFFSPQSYAREKQVSTISSGADDTQETPRRKGKERRKLPLKIKAHTVDIDASPKIITLGESSLLTWTSEYAPSASIDQGIGEVDAIGSLEVFPTQTITYTITTICETPTGTVTDSVIRVAPHAADDPCEGITATDSVTIQVISNAATPTPVPTSATPTPTPNPTQVASPTPMHVPSPTPIVTPSPAETPVPMPSPTLVPTLVAVPDVVGKSQSDAESAITAAVLLVGNVTTQSSNTVAAGNVISQQPEGGVMVAGKTSVDMVVSVGPVAMSDAYNIDMNDTEALNIAAPGVLGNDSFVESSTLTASLIKGCESGQLQFNADGSFTYTPDAGFNRTDSFTYMFNDGTNGSNVATAYIDVTADGAELDLTLTADTCPMKTNTQTLEVSGAVTVSLHNNGEKKFTGSHGILVFEDRDADGEYDSNVDKALGTKTFQGSIEGNSVAEVDVPVSDTVKFIGSPVYVYGSSVPATYCGKECNNQPEVGEYQPIVE